MRHTIFTPVYNRAKNMFGLAEHINNINYSKNEFEWIVVNDGSTDNLLDEMQRIREAFPEINLKVISKPNGGIHTAQNCAVRNAEGKYITRIDSDDYLLPDSLINKDEALLSVSADDNDKIAGCVGICLNAKDRTIRGTKFPKDVQVSKGYLLRRLGVSGDRNFCIKRKIMQHYLLPEFDDTKWVPEGGYLWLEIDKQFDTLFINVPMAVCTEPNDQSYLGGLKAKNLSNIMSVYYHSLYVLNSGKRYYSIYIICKSFYKLCESVIDASSFNVLKYNLKRLLKDTDSILDKFILFILYPLVLLGRYIKK